MKNINKNRRILIDGYNMGMEKGTGVATYGRNLSYAAKSLGYQVDVLYGKKSTRSKNPLLSEIAFFDASKQSPNRLLEFVKMLQGGLSAPIGCHVDTVPISGSVVYDSLRSRMPEFDQILNSPDVYLRSHRAFRWLGQFAQVDFPGTDIAHWTYPLPIRVCGAANIYTLHDLVPLRLPHTTLDNKRRYLKLCKRIADTADHIVTVSETSRSDIINLLNVNPEKVTNTFQSVSFPKKLIDKTQDVVRDELAGTFNLPYKGYFLFYGAIEPKKNIGRLIEAYLGSAVKTPLVIVGAPGWHSDEELKLLTAIKSIRLQSSNLIIYLEYLPLSMLVSLIRGAKATIFPSLYEGFGLPVLESMLLGTAVITSNTSSLPEVAGDSACLVNPYDTPELAGTIRELDTNVTLRVELENKGIKRATFFSQEGYARKLDTLYSDLKNRRNR